MKTIFAALLGATALATPVMASDIYGGSTKDGIDQIDVSKNPFAGFYIGVQAGGEFANIDIFDQFDGIGADGVIGGAHGGYNFALGRVVIGPYFEGGLSNVNTEIGGFDAINQDWYVQTGLLVGYQISKSTLASVHAGYDFSKWSSDFVGADIDVGAFVIGGGLDTMISSNVSLGIKVDYLMVHDAEVSDIDVTDFVDESEAIRAMVRLTYRR